MPNFNRLLTKLTPETNTLLVALAKKRRIEAPEISIIRDMKNKYLPFPLTDVQQA